MGISTYVHPALDVEPTMSASLLTKTYAPPPRRPGLYDDESNVDSSDDAPEAEAGETIADAVPEAEAGEVGPDTEENQWETITTEVLYDPLYTICMIAALHLKPQNTKLEITYTGRTPTLRIGYTEPLLEPLLGGKGQRLLRFRKGLWEHDYKFLLQPIKAALALYLPSADQTHLSRSWTQLEPTRTHIRNIFSLAQVAFGQLAITYKNNGVTKDFFEARIDDIARALSAGTDPSTVTITRTVRAIDEKWNQSTIDAIGALVRYITDPQQEVITKSMLTCRQIDVTIQGMLSRHNKEVDLVINEYYPDNEPEQPPMIAYYANAIAATTQKLLSLSLSLVPETMLSEATAAAATANSDAASALPQQETKPPLLPQQERARVLAAEAQEKAVAQAAARPPAAQIRKPDTAAATPLAPPAVTAEAPPARVPPSPAPAEGAAAATPQRKKNKKGGSKV